jgi:hypothetical protein
VLHGTEREEQRTGIPGAGGANGEAEVSGSTLSDGAQDGGRKEERRDDEAKRSVRRARRSTSCCSSASRGSSG